MSNMYDIIASLCLENGNISISKMCKDTGISRGALTDLKMGRTKSFSIETISKIAEYFGVSTDYIAGKTDKKSKPALTKKDEPDITFDDFTYALHNEAKELTEENKEKLLEMAKLFKLGQEQDRK